MAALTTAGAQQHGEPEAESEEGLTATLNGDGFTTGDTIAVGAAITTEATKGNNNSASKANSINVTAVYRSTLEAITYAEQAYVAMQNNDTQSVLRNLNLALNALESVQENLTLTAVQRGSNTSRVDNKTVPETTTEAVTNNGSSSGNEAGATTGVSIVSDASILTDTAFQPNPVNVSEVSTVTWTNNDLVPHTVTSGENGQADGKFDSSIMSPEERFSFTFTEAGAYSYFCILHPNMVETVNVMS